MNWIKRLWAEWQGGFWKIVPHKFYALRGSAFCGRCVVHWDMHPGAGRRSW